MAFIDLFIGGFVLPMRFVSAYSSPLTSKLCAALTIGESCALASVIYAILFMIYIRLYDLNKTGKDIRRRYLIIIVLTSWIIFFLFYGIPFMTNYSSYLLTQTSLNITTYCTTYTTSIYHPPWMSYTEIGIIYSFPFVMIFVGLCVLIYYLCQTQPKRRDSIQRKYYREQRQMTWHVTILSLAFVCLWLPWIITRILFTFTNTIQIQRALQITYYILVFKSVIFPILYASTNASFRGSFAIYRHRRILLSNRVWTLNGNM